MKILPNEEKIEEYKSLILTSNAVIQETNLFLGNSAYTEIPLKSIDSLSKCYTYPTKIAIFSFLFLIAGFVIFYIDKGMNVISITLIFLAIISFFLFILLGKKELVINSGAETIVEDAIGSKVFFNKLRQEIYKRIKP